MGAAASPAVAGKEAQTKQQRANREGGGELSQGGVWETWGRAGEKVAMK